jgi:molybdate transport system substrate-binding protein
MRCKALFSILLLQLFAAAALQAETVRLSVAASMTDALKELVADYRAKHENITLLPNFGASGALAKQIEQGAPVDIFISANPDWVKYLADKQLIVPETIKIFAFNRLVFIGKPKTADFTLKQAAMLQRVAIGNPQNVPAGQYAKQALENVGIYATMEKQKKFVRAPDVRHALLYADQEEVDGAFVYKTDALLAKHAVIILTVPENLHDKITCPMVLTLDGVKNDRAKSFYTYLAGKESKGVLEKHGFSVQQ